MKVKPFFCFFLFFSPEVQSLLETAYAEANEELTVEVLLPPSPTVSPILPVCSTPNSSVSIVPETPQSPPLISPTVSDEAGWDVADAELLNFLVSGVDLTESESEASTKLYSEGVPEGGLKSDNKLEDNSDTDSSSDILIPAEPEGPQAQPELIDT